MTIYSPDYDKKVPDYDKKVPESEKKVHESEKVPKSDKKYLKKAYRPKCCTDNNEDEDNSPNNADNTKYSVNVNKRDHLCCLMKTINLILNIPSSSQLWVG